MSGYRDLAVGQRAMDLTIEVYKAARTYPSDERYGLVSQTQRAAVSVAANIAEGRGRGSTREFHRFVGISLGSLAELETHMILATRLGYVSRELTEPLLREAGELTRMLGALKRSLKQKLNEAKK